MSELGMDWEDEDENVDGKVGRVAVLEPSRITK